MYIGNKKKGSLLHCLQYTHLRKSHSNVTRSFRQFPPEETSTIRLP